MKIEERYTVKAPTKKGRFPELTTTEEGLPIIVRPIRSEDKPLLIRFLKSLSSQSIYLRFFSHHHHFSGPMIHRLTHIDGRNEIVLIALDLRGDMLGKSTIFVMEDEKRAEFSVLISDEWQGRGIGAALLKRCLMLAKARGVETVWGRVLCENTKMLALGKKLGFVKKATSDANEFELVVDLSRMSD